MTDYRKEFITSRLSTLTKEELQRILGNQDKLCVDTYNYDEANKTYCPLALAMNLHTIENPTNELITNLIGDRFQPVNFLKGMPGQFYTSNRKEDLINLIKDILNASQT